MKWEREPANYRMEAGYETDQNLINARLLAIESLSSVFEAVGDEKGAKTASALLLDFKEYAGIT